MSTSVTSDTRAKTAKQLRRMRAKRMGVRLGLGLGVPTLVAAIYLGLIVSPRYESVSTFTIQSADSSGHTSALLMLVSSVPGSATRDIMLTQEYIRSRDMLTHVLEHHHFAEHYSRPEADIFTRLPEDASFEETYEYYLDRVQVEHDSTAGTLTLRVQAYDSATAHALGEAILVESERMVNELSDHSRQDRIQLSQTELTRAEGRLSRARAALRELQGESGHLSPVASAEAILEVQARLEGELAIARAELSTLTATMPRNAPEVVAARRRVQAFEQEIENQGTRLAGRSNQGLDQELAEFEPVMIEKEFAQRAYESALTSLELARVDASRQHRYLVRIAGPSIAEEAAYPNFWYSLLTVLLMSFAILSVGTLLIASVREHANV